jgi:hypothetical protein
MDQGVLFPVKTSGAEVTHSSSVPYAVKGLRCAPMKRPPAALDGGRSGAVSGDVGSGRDVALSPVSPGGM